MKQPYGVIREILLGSDGVRQALIHPAESIKMQPGQYLSSGCMHETETDLGTILYQVGENNQKDLLRLGPIPERWKIGDRLSIYGPFGKGFELPSGHYRTGLMSISGSVEWLMPAIHMLLEGDNQVTFIGDANLSDLPVAVEAYPLESWQDHLSWMDELIIECPRRDLQTLRGRLGVDVDFSFPVPVQLMVFTPMPCTGLGNCGVCAVRTENNDYKLTCSDGPVFDMHSITW